jgi:ABC-type sugar transport system permease subunit
MAVTTALAPAKPTPRAARRPRPPGYASQMVFVATGLIPILAMFVVFAFAPVGIVLWLSLHRYNQLAPTAPFIGLRNFEYAAQTDPYFVNALLVTLKYALVAVPLNLVIALPIAIGLNQVTRLKAVFRSAFFLPTVASAVAVSLIWRYIYDPQAGSLNVVLATVGLPQPSWLADPATALWAILVTAVWQDLGYNILILLAGLQTIPDDFYDAAKVDGAGPWPRFIDITLPLLSRTLLFVSVLTMISYLQQFTYVNVMPREPGDPIHSTETMVQYIYTKAFSNMQLGYAAAISVVLMAIILVITLIQFRLIRSRWEY